MTASSVDKEVDMKITHDAPKRFWRLKTMASPFVTPRRSRFIVKRDGPELLQPDGVMEERDMLWETRKAKSMLHQAIQNPS